jgi:hypothetical protein
MRYYERGKKGSRKLVGEVYDEAQFRAKLKGLF